MYMYWSLIIHILYYFFIENIIKTYTSVCIYNNIMLTYCSKINDRWVSAQFQSTSLLGGLEYRSLR